MRMANLINSMTNDKLSQLNGNSVSTKDVGKIAKLVSEIKLMEGFQPIKLTASRDIFINEKPAQLLEARTQNNKGFSLIMESKGISIDAMKQTGLEVDSKNNQFKLSYSETPASILNTSTPTKNAPNTSNTGQYNQTQATINKHYTQQTNPTSVNQSVNGINKAQQNRIETQVQLNSKVENLTVIAKISNTAPTSLTPNNQTVEPKQSGPIIQQESPIKAKPLTSNLNQANLSAKSESRPNQTITPQINTAGSSPSENEINTNTQAVIKKSLYQNSIVKDASDKNLLNTNTDQVRVSQTNNAIEPKAIVQQASITTKHQDSQASYQNRAVSTPVTVQTAPEAQFKQSSIASEYKVSIDSSEFIISAKQPLKVGDNIQVIRDLEGKLQLLPNQPQTKSNILSQEFAKSLPQQLSKPELINFIQSLTSLQNANGLDKGTQKVIQQLLNSIPNLQQLETPAAIKQAIMNSGLFLENKLSTTPTNLNQDIKANLLSFQTNANNQINEKTQSAPSLDLIEQNTKQAISQAIERITSTQIRNLLELNKIEGMNLPLIIEVPIQDKGETSIFQLEIDQDQHNQETSKNKRKWLAKLLFDFPQTGKFEARVSVEESKVAVIFAAENSATENKIRKHSNVLAKQLTDKGLEITQLDSFCKPIKEAKQLSNQPNLIDVRT